MLLLFIFLRICFCHWFCRQFNSKYNRSFISGSIFLMDLLLLSFKSTISFIWQFHLLIQFIPFHSFFPVVYRYVDFGWAHRTATVCNSIVRLNYSLRWTISCRMLFVFELCYHSLYFFFVFISVSSVVFAAIFFLLENFIHSSA